MCNPVTAALRETGRNYINPFWDYERHVKLLGKQYRFQGCLANKRHLLSSFWGNSCNRECVEEVQCGDFSVWRESGSGRWEGICHQETEVLVHYAWRFIPWTKITCGGWGLPRDKLFLGCLTAQHPQVLHCQELCWPCRAPGGCVLVPPASSGCGLLQAALLLVCWGRGSKGNASGSSSSSSWPPYWEHFIETRRRRAIRRVALVWSLAEESCCCWEQEETYVSGGWQGEE